MQSNFKQALYSVGNTHIGLLGHHIKNDVINLPGKIEIPIAKKILGLSVNKNHCISWDENGDAYAWGVNLNGVLGVQENRRRIDEIVVNPEKVFHIIQVEKISNSKIISCFAFETCSFALTYKGKLFYWGL